MVDIIGIPTQIFADELNFRAVLDWMQFVFKSPLKICADLRRMLVSGLP